jgi:hypothetical protein
MFFEGSLDHPIRTPQLPHRITFSARMRMGWGIVTPSTVAVLGRMTSARVVDRPADRSAGFSRLAVILREIITPLLFLPEPTTEQH